MESFFNYDFLLNENSMNQSSFVPYTNEFSSRFDTPVEKMRKKKKKDTNVKNRMVEFLKKNPAPPPPPPPRVMITPVESERERNQKHVMNERMRREKEKHNYHQLHKLLPHGTKKDKKSIVQIAAREIEELESYNAKLKKKNKELKKAIGIEEDKTTNSKSIRISNAAEIKIKVGNPSSGIDAMLEVLNCLKNTTSVAESIQSSFSSMEFSSVFQIHTSVDAAEVENAVQRTLYEVEKKFQCPNFNLADRISASARFHDHYNAIK